MNTTTKSVNSRIYVLVGFFILVWFCNLDYRSLVQPDEGRYAEIAREMAVTEDWVTPRLNGIKYFEKPPLQYWITAAGYRTFGEHEWTARLWTALTGFAGVLLIGYAGARLFGRQAGFFAALVLASSLLYAGFGHINTLDMGVTFSLTLGLAGFLLAQKDETEKRAARQWMWLVWAAMGLAFLSKGLIGLVVPSVAIVAYAVVQRDLSFLKRLHPLSGIGIMLAVLMPWVIAVSRANPEFAQFFFIHEHFQRYLTQVHHRTAPWWFFIPILIAGMLPWTALLGRAVKEGWKGDESGSSFKPRRFLLVYAVVIFLFFSASQSKLPAYILPIFPAFALLVGNSLTRIRGRTFAWMILPIAILALAGALLSPFIVNFGTEKVPAILYRDFSKWIMAGTLTLFAATSLALFLAWRERVEAAVVAVATGGLIFLQLGMTGHQSLAPSYSTAHLATIIRPLLDEDTSFYSVRTYEQTLPFYIKRTVTLVDYRDELDFGLKQQPEFEIPTVQEFEKRWRNDRKAFAILGPDLYLEMTRHGLPMRLLSEDARRVIVVKP